MKRPNDRPESARASNARLKQRAIDQRAIALGLEPGTITTWRDIRAAEKIAEIALRMEAFIADNHRKLREEA